MLDLTDLLNKLVTGVDLSHDEMIALMQSIMSGQASDAQIGSALTALRIKGETVEEIAAAAEVMRSLSLKVMVDNDQLVDTCGTGGSGISKFNVSTASALVLAAAGAKVAKHGNRAASGVSGSADVLEAAGLPLDLNPEQVARSIEQVGVGFLFAVNHHGAMKHAIGPRRELRFRTIFNLLGPLTNPAGAKRQVLGVFDRKWIQPMAEVLIKLGVDRALVVHARDGLDELSVAAMSDVVEVRQGECVAYSIDPVAFGCGPHSLDDLAVNNAKESLAMIEAAFSGQHVAAENMIALNAGAALFVSERVNSMEDGVALARDMMRSGQASSKLGELISFCQSMVTQ